LGEVTVGREARKRKGRKGKGKMKRGWEEKRREVRRGGKIVREEIGGDGKGRKGGEGKKGEEVRE